MTVPEGFTVKLFAGEPDVRQPIALCLDDRGRLWVAEAYSYPIRRPDKEAKDRILIFEDTDGDGKFDKRTVFMEGLNLVSGLEVGFGGVWIGAAPYLLFVPVKEGEDKPAGPAQVLLDGWGYQDTHETLNTFLWGPDGWLYGCHGVFTHSRVGKPGTPDDERTPINAGVWRYHPKKHVFEVFAHGTSNPWGLDFDDRGQAFVEACVIPHNWHIIQGGRYQRQAGPHFNPYTYDDIKTIADHRHYLGANPHGGNEKSRQRRRRSRPLRHDDLPRRRLAGGVSRPDVHGQHPRPAAQRRSPDAEGLRIMSPAAAPTSCWPTTPGRGSSTSATAPTATSTSSTGTTSRPATTATRRSGTARTGGFTRSASRMRRRRRSIFASSPTAIWSNCN